MGVTNAQWIKRGRQKRELAIALQRPMTPNELFEAVRKHCPKVQLRDIWRLLKHFEKREIISCLSPREPKCRVYFFTEEGSTVVKQSLGISVSTLPPNVNWTRYAQVLRGKVRMLVLLQICRPPLGAKLAPQTIAQVRKQLAKIYPVGLGSVIRAMHQLESLKLIRHVSFTKKKRRPLYLPTPLGEEIVRFLLIKGKTTSERNADNTF